MTGVNEDFTRRFSSYRQQKAEGGRRVGYKLAVTNCKCASRLPRLLARDKTLRGRFHALWLSKADEGVPSVPLQGQATPGN